MCPADFASHESEHRELERSTPPVRRVAAPMVVGHADARAEHDADRVAHEVVARLSSGESGESHVHDGCHGIARVAAPSTGSPEVGREGGAISEDLTSRIEARRGTGSALPTAVRRRMEAGFGRSLADVRVHTDGESARLNRAVSARAFTTGKDIFFGAGEYAPDTAAGEKVLAHEIAHTQQGGGGARRLHRLAFDKPKWDRVTDIEVFGEGSSRKSALFSDGSGKDLVVKAGLTVADENTVAASLHQGVTKSAKASFWQKMTGGAGTTGQAPKSRLATPGEKDAIAAKSRTKLDLDEDEKFLEAMEDKANKVLIQQRGGGTSVKKLAKQPGAFQTTEDDVGDTDSLFHKMIYDPAPIKTLGRHAAVDVVMGMHDRVVDAFNPENFLYDAAAGSFVFIDNAKSTPWGHFTEAEVSGAFGNDKVIIPAKDSFDSWASRPWVTRLAGDIPALAEEMVAVIMTDRNGIQRDLPGPAKAFFKLHLAQDGVLANLKQWVEEGLEEGKRSVLKLLRNPLKLVAGVPQENKADMVQALVAHGLVLEGVDPNIAWQRGAAAALKLVPAPKAAKPAKVKAPKKAKAPKKGKGAQAAEPATTPWRAAVPSRG